jgi:hypothetical protein
MLLFAEQIILPAFIALSLFQVDTIPSAALIIGINGCMSQILLEH